MTQLNSTAHSSTGDVDTNHTSEADLPIGGGDQLMEEHPQPPCVHPSANQSLDPTCRDQDQIDPALRVLDHTLDHVDHGSDRANRDGTLNTEDSCNGPERETGIQSGSLGTNGSSKGQTPDEAASATDVDVSSTMRNTQPVDVNRGCQYPPQQSPSTTDSLLESNQPATENDGTLHAATPSPQSELSRQT